MITLKAGGTNMVTINNDINFTNDFINQLVTLLPTQVIEFWQPKYSNIGLVRFDNGKLDAVYIQVPSKFGQHNLIKFTVIKGNYIFDSVYSHYDVITAKDSHPWEYRYDKDLNVLATYKFAESEDEEILSTQYKDGKKLKEYLYSTDTFQPKLFRDLLKSNTITFKSDNINLINCLKVNGNKKIIYYWIR